MPSEVVVPLENLGAVMEEIEHKVDQPVVKEGVIVRHGAGGRPEAIILGFIPSDQRRFDYNFVFGLVLTIMDIAEKHGGRPYSTGMYFASRADEVLGAERVERLREFKREVDPRGVLNPGKVIGSGALGKALTLAAALEPLIRPLGNRVIAKTVASPRPGGVGARHPGRRRPLCLLVLAVRLLRRPVRPVLRARLGEPEPARQVVLAARAHRGP